ncbi:hypothetical protein Tco_0463205 [Tanacetum coccineum]
MPVEKSSASKKPERQIPTGHRFLNKKTTTVPEKTMNPRSCLRWKPTGRIFSNVRLRWIPTGKLLNSCTGKVDSEHAHGSIVDIPHIHACKQTLGLRAGTSFNGQKQQRIDLNANALYNEKQENLRVWPRSSMFKRRLIAADQASVFMAMMSVHISSGLVLHQMTSDHNRSELRIHDHGNEPSSSKLVPKVVPLAVKTATSRQELELLFHHHISMLRTTGIMPTKIELTLEQSQQGVSNDVLVTWLIANIEDEHHGTSVQEQNPSAISGFLSTEIVHLSWSTPRYLLTSHLKLLILNRWQSAPASEY